MKPLLFDVHLDLSLNAMEYDRDLREPVHELRKREEGLTDLKARAMGTVAFPEMRKGNMGLCVATQLAGTMKPGHPVCTWNSPHQAWAETQGQLAWYRAMEEDGQLRQIRNVEQLEAHLKAWEADPDNEPIGYVLSLEGADSMITLGHLERAYEYGLRALGPAHYGKGRYALGHDQDGPMNDMGKELVREMDRLGMILDVTHLCDKNFWDALEIFEGPVWASHSNCRALVDDVRQFGDDQLKALIDRGAVIGAAYDAWMMVPGWIKGKTTPQEAGVKIEHACDHIDHICQLAGNAKHCGIGSDLDGGFGTEQSPADLDTIADLQTMTGSLSKRGYSEEDISGIMSGNFLRVLRENWGG
ncbi:MAG: membrane dipeptidase [Verrucomicrobiales bacterium]|jgi:membrane dipeptidase